MIYHSDDILPFKKKALQWASSFEVCCYLDSNCFTDKYSKFDVLIAAGVKHQALANVSNAFTTLKDFRSAHAQEWVTGFLTYDLKNELEDLHSRNADHLAFPDLYFFVPQYLIKISGVKIEIICNDPEAIFEIINNSEIESPRFSSPININNRLSQAEYIQKVDQIKEHISRGDVYVTNFCQEFYAEDTVIDPVQIFARLNQNSPNPFAAFFKYQHHYILCASPERFLAKRGDKLISQPIKGTAPRGANDAEDLRNKQTLSASIKEQQENVMVVDMVRNDLTRCAKPGTVQVEELFGLYSFNQLHQLISTVTCKLANGLSNVDALTAVYPMGSMTGAPKVSAMRLMEAYEVSKRGVYSGALGYFSPDGDFDFNVVIRSLLYNAGNKYLSFHAGSAITYGSNARSEYEECLLKTKAIQQALSVL